MENAGMEHTLHKKKRMANIECLRILAMMMVVMLHFLDKGGFLPDMAGELDAAGYAAWILETLSIVAVNVYMLITGYFLAESGFKCKRLVQLVLQTLFYSLLVPLVMLALGLLVPSQITIYQMLNYIFPTQMLQYWFVSAYVLMYLFSPLLAAAVKSMSKRQLQVTIMLLLLVLSVSKSILPVRLELDNRGNDGIWFMCVFLVAAYIRLYGIPLFKNGRRSTGLYFLFSGMILGVTLLVRFIFIKTGVFENFITAAYGYNHIFNLCAAISLFYAFYYWKLSEGRLSGLACRVAPYTFGVYLLHEQLEIRYRWPAWLGLGKASNPVIFVIQAVGAVCLVFVLCLLVDMVRGLIFRGIGHLLKGTAPDVWMQKIDDGLRKQGAERGEHEQQSF